ncbi:MAG TPA: DUF4124 domain-containing protein [Patescibacteria group bacterium]|nr:DUF4124 domain-containing protein [Patescibacteria group bacterium]
MHPTLIRIAGMVVAALLLDTADVGAVNIYKCTGKDGGVVVSNTPCAKGAEPDAKLSTSASGTASVHLKPCERVEGTGAGLVQIASKLTPAQTQAVEAEAFGRRNSAGASRVLAEIGRGGALRVCAYFPGGDFTETLIETNGLVRRDGVVDAADPVLLAATSLRNGFEICSAAIDACRSRFSAVGVEREECISRIAVCSTGGSTDCCPKACFDAYWKPPFEHAAGIAAMQGNDACKTAGSLRR